MADDTAHVPPGPPSDTADAAPQPQMTGGDATPAVVLAADPPVHLGPRGATIEVLGHGSGATTMAEAERAVAVLDRAGEGDAPTWSFDAPLQLPPAGDPPSAPDRHQAELPFARTAAAAPPAPRHPLFGPIGRSTPTLLVPVLASVTLGGYALAWHRRFNREIEEFDPKIHVRGGRSVAAVMVPWLLGLLTTLAGAALIVTARLGVHLPFDAHLTNEQAWLLLGGLLAIPYLTLILPFSVVAVVMTMERLRCVEEHLGVTTDRQVRPVGTVMLLAVPVVGGLVMLGVMQRRLNAVWAAVAPTGLASR